MSDSFAIDTTQVAGTRADQAPLPSNAAPSNAVSHVAAASAGTSDVSPFPSPSEHLDPALGIEVMQYVNENGTVIQSFPSQRQLDAYRDGVGIESQGGSDTATKIA